MLFNRKFYTAIPIILALVFILISVLEQRAYENLLDLLKVYSAYDQQGPIKLIRHGKEYDGGYVVAEKSFKKADVLMGYGIADDNSFEEQFSDIYHKPSYGFDCGIGGIGSKNKLFTFVNECISSDKFLYSNSKSSKRISSFTQQLNDLHLKNKKIFIKMDIEGAEYEAFDDILKYESSITGIALEIHFEDRSTAENAFHRIP